MPKTVEDLIRSRKQRADILQRFGQVPQSIMRHDPKQQAIDPMGSERDYESTRNAGGHTGKLYTVFRVSGQSVRSGSLSRFPQNIGRALLLLYTDERDTVVDPFAGHNSRMELCWRNGRHYIGQDISADFHEANLRVAEQLADEAATDMFAATTWRPSITLHHGDSRALRADDGAGDFTITSPPYWDLEYYGDEAGQLGKAPSYEVFLACLAEVARENFRALRPGAFCVWCVNDFRKDGTFYSYHEDTARLLRDAGFVQHDIAITDLGTPIRAAFAQQVVEQRILPKRHEYCLVFVKPEAGAAAPDDDGGICG